MKKNIYLCGKVNNATYVVESIKKIKLLYDEKTFINLNGIYGINRVQQDR